jgi:hypothetical protein
MSFWTTRRISGLLTAFVLAVGLVAPGFGAPDLVVKSTMTVANDMPMSSDMPGKCNGCAGHEKGLAAAACSSVLCGSMIALPSLMVVLSAVPAEAPKPADEPDASGRTVPTDPYPPRTTILS